MGCLQHFSLRRLAPFRGTMQVIQHSHGRAVTADGQRWQTQLLARLRTSPWGMSDGDDPKWRYVVAGEWSANNGSSRVALDPAWVADPRLDVIDTLEQELVRAHSDIPFAPRDRLECWLLDGASGEPLALLASLIEPSESYPRVNPVWLPYNSPDSATGPGATVDPDAVAERVRLRAGRSPGCRWYRREAQGRGTALAPDPGQRDPARLPELLLCDNWTEPGDAELIGNYLKWQAPRLLTLPDLSPDTRRRLERAAIRDPVAVARYYRLYPQLTDPDLIRTLRVEAQLVLSA